MIAFLSYLAFQWFSRRLKPVTKIRVGEASPSAGSLSFSLIGAALAGPVIGVSCFQWALLTEKSAIVLAITATSPLVVTLFARAFEQEKTPPLAIIGSLVSVSGVIAICLTKLG